MDLDQLSASFEQTARLSQESMSGVLRSINQLTSHPSEEGGRANPHSVSQQRQQHASRQAAQPLSIRVHIPADALVPDFTDHQVLHYLLLNVMGNMGERLPDQVPVISMTDDEITSMRKNLKIGWWNNRPIQDYMPYYRTKERVFQELIRDKVTRDKWLGPADPLNPLLPCFGFAGAFTAMAEVPFSLKDTVFHFWKEDNRLIYCKKGMTSNQSHGNGHNHGSGRSFADHGDASGGRTNREFKSDQSRHMRMNFHRHLLHQSTSDIMTEDEKYFKVCKCNIGKNTIVSMSEVNALDTSGQDVKILLSSFWNNRQRSQLEKDRLMSERFLELWSHARITNQVKVIIGDTEPYSHNLTGVRIIQGSSESLTDSLSASLVTIAPGWDARTACHFVDRFLTYVGKIMQGVNDWKVVTFRVCRNDRDMRPVIESNEASHNIRTDREYLRI